MSSQEKFPAAVKPRRLREETAIVAMSLAAWLDNRLAVSSASEPKPAATYWHSLRGGVHVWMTLEMNKGSKIAVSRVSPQWPQAVTITLVIYLLVFILFNTFTKTKRIMGF